MKIFALVLVIAAAAFAMMDAAPNAGISQPGVDTWLEEIAYFDVEAAGIPNAYTVGCGWDGVSASTAASTIWSTSATSAYGAAWDALGDCLWVTSANATGIVDQIAADGSLVDHHTLIAAATFGGATMAGSTPINELYILPDAMQSVY